MKKVYALLCLLSFGSIAAHAQDTKSFRFGIKVAPNLGFIHADTKELKSDGAQLGFTFGLLGDFMIGADHNYAFSTGLLLNNVAGKSTFPFGNTNLSYATKYQYIEMPITLKLMTNEIGYITYYGQIGFGAAFNIAAKATYDSFDSNGKPITVTDDDVMANTQLFKASLILGAGMQYNFSGNTSLLLGLTYDNGFTNILKNTDANKIGDTQLKEKLNYLELTVGMFF